MASASFGALRDMGTNAGNRNATAANTLRPGAGYVVNPKTNLYDYAGGADNGGQSYSMDQNGQLIPYDWTKTGPQSYYQGGGTGQLNGQPNWALDGLNRAINGLTAGGGASYAPTSTTTPGMDRVHLGKVDDTAAVGSAANQYQNAAFGKAKANAGSLGRSALEGLRSGLAERGLLGGGTEARGLVSKLAEATNPLSDLNTAALGENVGIAKHNQDLNAQAAQTDFGGQVSQRNSDLSAQVAARGQDLSAEQAKAARNQAALSSLVNIFASKLY